MGEPVFHVKWLRRLEARMHLDPELNWTNPREAANDLLRRIKTGDGEFGLDVLDYVLRHLDESYDFQPDAAAQAQEVADALTEGSSAWEVTHLTGINYALMRRESGPFAEAVEEVRTASERAGEYLYEAWRHFAGRTPVPDQAYFQAVLAVEAAAKPVVLPNDPKATLGRMIRAIESNPAAFTFALGAPEDVLPPARLLWQTHRRHGTNDREAPMGMSQQEADAGVHLALTLVRWFTSSVFARAN
jgi:hypothetical protein